MQSLPYWGQDANNQLLSPCNAYELTRTELEPLFSVTFTYTNCYGQLIEEGLYPPERMRIYVCSTTVPTVQKSPPIGGSGGTVTLVGACENNEPLVDCGKTNSYNGGQSFPTTIMVILGSGTGLVNLVYNSDGIPDKFIVRYSGSEVINTGYRGDSFRQAGLNAALAARGLPPEEIQGPAAGTASFYKSTNFPIVAYVDVWAPMEGTGWSLQLQCPV